MKASPPPHFTPPAPRTPVFQRLFVPPPVELPGSVASFTPRLLRGYLLMGTSVIFFAIHALVVKHLHTAHHIDVWQTLWVRFLIGSIVTCAVFLPRGELKPLRAVKVPLLAFRGFMGVLGTICFYVTIPKLGAGVASLIAFTFVLWSILLAAWILSEVLTPRRLTWMTVAFVGLVLLMLRSNSNTELAPWYFYAIALCGAVSAGFVIVSIRHLHHSETTPTIFWAQCAWGIVLTAPALFFIWKTPSLYEAGVLLFCGLLAVAGQLCMTDGFKHLSVGAGAGFQLAVPVLTAIGGVLLLGEHLGFLQWFAAGLIVLGTWFCVTPGRGARTRRQMPEKAGPSET